MVTKPKLWKYKSGAKAGKLRPQAKQYLSFKLKEFHKRDRIIKEQFKEEIIKPKKPKVTVIRNQLTFNSIYAVSLRAIGFDKTEEQLENAMQEVLNSNPALMSIPFDTEGFESEELDSKEDAGIRGDTITVELNIRGNTTYTEI